MSPIFWVKCLGCSAEWGVGADDDTVSEKPACEVCGGREWKWSEEPSVDQLVRHLEHMGHFDLAAELLKKGNF